MKRKVLGILFCMVATLPAADFQAGLTAYNKGDFATALEQWQPLAEAGDANAQYNLALLYARGQGVQQDYAKAIEWYKKAADHGVAAAEYNLGVMFANGQGVKADPSEAGMRFLKAAQQGVGDAASGLAKVYAEDSSGAPHDHAINNQEIEKWLRKAADEGNASAAFHLGVMYDLGQGAGKDYAQALRWYRQAADGGYASAMTNLGVLYYNGQGVKRDLSESYIWFERAQKLGDPRAKDLVSMARDKLTAAQLSNAQSSVDQWRPARVKETLTANLFAPRPAPSASSLASGPQEEVEAHAAPLQLAAKPEQEDTWNGVGRIVAVGDVYGDFEQLVTVLESARLIDSNGDWIGGKAHLVQTGNVVDRGPDSRAVMDLFMKLQRQAAAAGGAVHCLMGNHEAMNLYGDLRFVAPAEFAAFGSTDPNGGFDAPQGQGADGHRERQQAFGPDGLYGKWLRGEEAIIKIDRTLFVHAGLGAKYANWPLERINTEIHRELGDFTTLHGGIVTDREGPLWDMDLAKGDEKEMAPLVEQLLKQYDVDRIVVGHAYAGPAVMPRFDRKVILVNVGISRAIDGAGQIACLEITNGEVFTLHRGQKLTLPIRRDSAEMQSYLQQVATLDGKSRSLTASPSDPDSR